MLSVCFFFNDTATTEIYTLSLHERSSDLGADSDVPRGRAPPAVRRAARSSMREGATPWASGSPRSRTDTAPSSRRRGSSSRSEEHTSELQSRQYLVCRLLLEKKKK